MSRPKKPQQEQTPPNPDKVTIAISVPAEGGRFVAECSFSVELWNRAKVDPSTTQFIIGTLREAMEQKGYKE